MVGALPVELDIAALAANVAQAAAGEIPFVAVQEDLEAVAQALSSLGNGSPLCGLGRNIGSVTRLLGRGNGGAATASPFRLLESFLSALEGHALPPKKTQEQPQVRDAGFSEREPLTGTSPTQSEIFFFLKSVLPEEWGGLLAKMHSNGRIGLYILFSLGVSPHDIVLFEQFWNKHRGNKNIGEVFSIAAQLYDKGVLGFETYFMFRRISYGFFSDDPWIFSGTYTRIKMLLSYAGCETNARVNADPLFWVNNGALPRWVRPFMARECDPYLDGKVSSWSWDNAPTRPNFHIVQESNVGRLVEVKSGFHDMGKTYYFREEVMAQWIKSIIFFSLAVDQYDLEGLEIFLHAGNLANEDREKLESLMRKLGLSYVLRIGVGGRDSIYKHRMEPLGQVMFHRYEKISRPLPSLDSVRAKWERL